MAALVFIVFLVFVAIFAPQIVDLAGARPPAEQSTKYLDSFGTPKVPSSSNLFDADPLGRDVFSRVVYGARVSLEVALVATAIAMLIGLVVGLLAGVYRGCADTR